MYITLSCPSGTLSHKWERDTNSPLLQAWKGNNKITSEKKKPAEAG